MDSIITSFKSKLEKSGVADKEVEEILSLAISTSIVKTVQDLDIKDDDESYKGLQEILKQGDLENKTEKILKQLEKIQGKNGKNALEIATKHLENFLSALNDNKS